MKVRNQTVKLFQLCLWAHIRLVVLDKSCTTKQTEVKQKLHSFGIKRVNGNDSELKSIITSTHALELFLIDTPMVSIYY